MLGQSVPGSGSSSGNISCSAMAVSNNLLFVADSKGVIHTLRCNIRNGILQVTPHQVMLKCMLQLMLRCLLVCLCITLNKRC